MGYRLAACAEMLFLELPFPERVRRIHERGFLVEIWDWRTRDLPALAATGAEFSSMTGYLRGDLTTAAGRAELLATARDSLRAAETLRQVAELGVDHPNLRLDLDLYQAQIGEGNLIDLVAFERAFAA